MVYVSRYTRLKFSYLFTYYHGFAVENKLYFQNYPRNIKVHSYSYWMYILEDAHNHDQNSIIHSRRSYLNVKHVLHDRLHMMKSLHPYLLESLVAYSYGDGLEHTSFFTSNFTNKPIDFG